MRPSPDGSPGERLLRLLLRLYPPSFRRRFGQETLRTCRDAILDARSRGRPAAARRWLRCAADLAVGGLAEWWRVGWTRGEGMDGIGRDLRFALRSGRKRPGLALVAILTLGLGVGANTAIFSVVRGVLLTPLEYPEPDEVVVLWDRDRETGRTLDATAANLEDWQTMAGSFEALAGVWGAAWALTGDGLPPERVFGGRAGPELFRVLGIRPVLGRVFRQEETRGQHRVALISHGLWRDRFGSDPDVVGRPITLDDVAHEVIGVLPPVSVPMNQATVVMTAPEARHVWLPVDRENPWYANRRSHMTLVLGRLAEGVILERAQDEMLAVARTLEERHPEANADLSVLVRPFAEEVVGDVRRDLLLLLGAVTLVLMVAAANLANLLLARAVDREREAAVRMALGAGRGRLVRQALTEVLLLGLGGAAVGAGSAVLGTRLLLDLVPEDLPRQAEVAVDAPVLGYALGIALLASLLAGVLPALRMAGNEPRAPLQAAGGRSGGTGGRRSRLRSALVVAQLALSVVLLAGSGLMLRTVAALRGVDPGVDLENVLDVPMLLPSTRYGSAEEVRAFQERVREEVAALPGVEEAVLAYDAPLETTWFEGFAIVGRPEPEPGEGPGGRYRPVGAGYFEAMGIPVLRGRTFDPRDRLDAPGAVVVNRALADRWFPGEDPVGQRILHGTPSANYPAAPEEWTIVGVVENVAFSGVREAPQPAFYAPLAQFPFGAFRVLARTRDDPLALATPVRAAVHRLDPDLPLPEVGTLEALRDQLLARERFVTVLVGLFAAVALAVAAAGVYGVLSYAVASRTGEMGVRLALGAGPRRVRNLLFGQAARLAVAGVALGLVGAVGVGRLLAGLLWGVSPFDPGVLGLVSFILLGVALLAGWVPARRASAIAPARALRLE